MTKDDMKTAVIETISILLENFTSEERFDILCCIPFCVLCGKRTPDDPDKSCNCLDETELSA